MAFEQYPDFSPDHQPSRLEEFPPLVFVPTKEVEHNMLPFSLDQIDFEKLFPYFEHVNEATGSKAVLDGTTISIPVPVEPKIQTHGSNTYFGSP